MNTVSSIQAGIYEGICRVCPWNGSTVNDKFCARTGLSTLITIETIRGESLPGANIEGVKDEFKEKAQLCAQTLVREALQENPKPLEPVETFDMADVAVVLLRHSGM